jgi:hypothetical protein
VEPLLKLDLNGPALSRPFYANGDASPLPHNAIAILAWPLIASRVVRWIAGCSVYCSIAQLERPGVAVGQLRIADRVSLIVPLTVNLTPVDCKSACDLALEIGAVASVFRHGRSPRKPGLDSPIRDTSTAHPKGCTPPRAG